MKTTKMKRLITAFAVLLIVSIGFWACNKKDFITQPEQSLYNAAAVKKFLTLPDNASPALKNLIKDWTKSEEQYHFTTAFLTKNGMPVWDKTASNLAMTNSINNANNNTSTFGSSNTVKTNNGIFFIPFIDTLTKEVTAYVYCEKNGDSNYTYQVFNKKNIINYPLKTKKQFDNGIVLMGVIASLENVINNKASIVFPTPYNYNYTNAYISFGGLSNSNTGTTSIHKSSANKSSEMATLSEDDCDEVIMGIINYNGVQMLWGYDCNGIRFQRKIPGSGAGGTGGSGTGTGSGTTITPPPPPPPSNPNNPVPNPPPGGSTGTPDPNTPNNPGMGYGGGSGGTTPSNPPNYSDGDPQHPFWQPDSDIDDFDSNGFLYSRINELKQILANNPNVLLPCDSLNIMPFETYGSMHQRVGSFKVPQNILNSLDSVNSILFGANITPLFEVQSLDYGTSTYADVNCDYFPVRIKRLPTGYTPKSLVEYFRKNINSFINGTPDIDFSPYNHLGVDYTNWYNQPYQNSIGAVVNITDQMIPVVLHVSAAVIVSDYYISDVVGNEKARFKFATITAPVNGTHPVSGNREFGIFADTSRPGEYAFYTMGVDRVTDILGTIASATNLGYERADKLWTRIQEQMAAFIIANGGEATFYTPKNIKARPKWDDVEQFLKGEIDFNELKRRLGC